ncbi:VOC family protein [Paramaledivibacter caminithermalis]|jgi:catechol 2,3-dioxygenase-like lactoylglutathione lyase family enzyme|uniref:Catechol 2,3-dioxygenase n=1 Tax=Paramaledivibacter caminithermalis (strain DSM 15212 / CIP 107654 / DViRD3) TaxID=1121301 RepID=A0A1M6QVN9_PARC5|nr:VOC family protein [Paramaledivibacter caminithermalis]SHK24266.1 Catechol 2,3-dioxygenase [Paramaledivibacter caminithermalis DSM 15212]
MKIRSVSHVGLTVSDFEKSVKWYYEMFGFKLISEKIINKEQAEELYELYRLKNTAVRLGFLRSPKGGIIEIFEFSSCLPSKHPVWNRPGPTHIALDVKNLKGWYNTLKNKGVEFFSEPQTTSGSDWVFLKDPDGNLIELIDLKYNYRIVKWLGGIVGKLMANGKFKKYYSEDDNAKTKQEHCKADS